MSAKAATKTSPALAETRIAVNLIIESTLKQPRSKQRRDATSFDELVASIKLHGVIEPVVVRPRGNKFELICGERRWLASKKAGLPDIPAVVREVNDDDAEIMQLEENLHREDLHDLDEAETYARLLVKVNGDVTELARRVSKPEVYVRRRLSLNDLVPVARESFSNGEITLGHALKIGPLSPEIQPSALEACFGWDWKGAKRVLDKSKLNTVRALTEWINERATQSLDRVPWDLSDATLVPKQGACTTCAFRTGTTPSLFPDAQSGNLCTNPIGFHTKKAAWLKRQAEAIETRDKKHPLFVSIKNYLQDDQRKLLPQGTLTVDSYFAVQGKHKCEFSRAAVLVDGDTFGSEIVVCIEKKCKDHAGRVNRPAETRRSTTPVQKSADEIKKFRARKQELFDIKVNESTRRMIFRVAIPLLPTQKITPDVRTWLERAALEWLMRIPSKTVAVLNDVLGRGEQYSADHSEDNKNYLSGEHEYIYGRGRHDDEDLRVPNAQSARLIKAMTDKQLQQLLWLMSFVHYGENEFGAHSVSQAAVISLAKELKIDYALRDAEARMLFVSRKAKASHQIYLDAIRAGRKPDVPSIYVDDEAPKEKATTKKSVRAKPATKTTSAKSKAQRARR